MPPRPAGDEQGVLIDQDHAGRWEVESTLLKLETPLGPDKVPDLAVSPGQTNLAHMLGSTAICC